MTDKPADKPARTPRHRPDAGYARGEETRRRIIDVAIRLFGERGFEGASTREIAKAAGVNAPALQYYFDNKEGVYQACAQHIADSSAAHFTPAVNAGQAVADDPNATPEQLFEAFAQLLDAIADHQFLPNDAEHRRLFMAHEQVGEGPAVLFELLDRSLRPRMGELSTRLVSRYCGLPPDSALRLRVIMMYGQLLSFSIGRRKMLTNLGWERFGPAEMAAIKQNARANCRLLMDHWRAHSD